MAMLKSLIEQGMAIVMVCHDLSVLEDATHVLIFTEKMIPMFMLEKEDVY